MKRYTKGFTLIELLVVIAIIGILSSVVLVSLNSARKKGTDARVQEETAQIRTQLESGYVSGTYADLTGGAAGSHIDTLTAGGPGNANLNTTINDILVQNSGALGNVNGLIIYSNAATAVAAADYGIYAKTSSGYVCVDSFGNTKINTGGGNIIAWGSITVPTTALCQ